MRIEPTDCLTFMSLISLSTSTTKLNYLYISLYPIVKYLLLTSFPRYGQSFFSLFMAQARSATAIIINQREKTRIRNLQYADRGNEVSKIFIITLTEVNRTRGKRTTFKFSGPYSEIWPAKLTNHTARTNWEISLEIFMNGSPCMMLGHITRTYRSRSGLDCSWKKPSAWPERKTKTRDTIIVSHIRAGYRFTQPREVSDEAGKR